jgi:hypothetical protein
MSSAANALFIHTERLRLQKIIEKKKAQYTIGSGLTAAQEEDEYRKVLRNL